MRMKRKNDGDLLEAYLAEISRIPLMSREEERRCGLEAQAGSEEARLGLVRANLRFVVSVAKGYRNRGLPLMDLISEGNVGLVQASGHFDPEYGCRFISYAAWWIRQAIQKAVADKVPMVRLPAGKRAELLRFQSFREPGVKPAHQRMERLQALCDDMVSLDAPLDESDGSPLVQSIPDPSSRAPEAEAEGALLREEIGRALACLSRREADVLRCRFGLDRGHGMSLEEIGRRYRVTKERVRQIEKGALRKLRQAPLTEPLRAYVS